MSKPHTLLVAISLFLVILMLHFIPKVDKSYKADSQPIILQDSVTARSYRMWGEGDAGQDINHYLLTGEISDFLADDNDSFIPEAQ